MSRERISRTRIKLCGLTAPEQVMLAAELGADAIGLVFYGPSPRYIETEAASRLAASCPPFLSLTGLFVNPAVAEVEAVLDKVPLDCLQFHGDESDDFCRQFRRPWIKAVRMRPEMNVEQVLTQWPGARGLLLDAWHPEHPGGTGLTFDWRLIPDAWRHRIILAGGLTPDNVGNAIQQVSPWGVDVSGGIEAGKGKKDSALMAAFVAAVREEDNRHD
ncbi:MAG: phosphoribosylanthranilate isomerase [Natronospirillum sp.]|uniref:phosphoribosylanthranilate isomerase n=1 Tax=Natronospirillum sp. TaxID=2812955 RepID=UPI0025DA7CD4|nr:phosphoribosylanthranilate isomerase [Natronospirillum sp.]MCH8551369.1 phosphoribosylanthranilate isomerase [Natronospirillum sp.]